MTPGPAPAQLPYIGLRPFDEADQRLYFGREEQINAVLTLLEDDAFLAIVGSSGSGKSSLVRAGLVPLVRQGFLLGCTPWQVAIAKPGGKPFEALAKAMAGSATLGNAALGGAGQTSETALREELLTLLLTETQALQLAHQRCGYGNDAGLLVVIDQFEELFAYRRGVSAPQGAVPRDEGAAFVRMLLRCANQRERPLRVLITMRSDFIGDCEAFLGLPETISRSQFLVPRMDRSQMERAIVGPSGQQGGGLLTFDFEDGLVTRVVNDAGDRPDQLPLLQHALMQTWKAAMRRPDNSLRLCLSTADYGDAGGVQQALSRHADAALSELAGDPSQAMLARRLFLLLCDVSAQGQLTRRRPTLAEVQLATGASRASIQAVARVFQRDDRNFLLPPAAALNDDAVPLDISHESLLRRWGHFQVWLSEEEVDAAELRDWLSRARRASGDRGWLDDNDAELARRWRDRVQQRGEPALWALRYAGPGAFEQVEGYIRASEDRIGRAKAELDSARAGQEALRQQVEQEKLLRLQAEADRQRAAAERAEADKAVAEKEKSQALAAAVAIRQRSQVAAGGGLLALVFGVVAVLLWWQARDALATATALARTSQANELATTAESLTNDFPDRSVLLALEARRIEPVPKANALLRAADAAFPYRLALRGHEDRVTSAQFSADGKTVLTASDDKTARLWDVASGKELRSLRGHEGSVISAQFSADGKTVLTASSGNTARLWACNECLPVEELAAEAARKVGRKLTPDERLQYGLPPAEAKEPSADK